MLHINTSNSCLNISWNTLRDSEANKHEHDWYFFAMARLALDSEIP